MRRDVFAAPQDEVRLLFFATPNELRKWFRRNHASADELWVGYYKKASDKPSITWAESVDEALCVGWIDGIRKGVDAESYKIRFTPRRRGSIWSALNIKRALALTKEGRMQPAGAKAFVARQENRSGIYSYEQCQPRLEEPYASQLRANQAAWNFFQAQAPSYRKIMGWWVVSAKQEATREKRLQKLIAESAREKRIR
jgi:uncharacterized protein YdeI (YjbR/CyaY-like superfamily)